MWNWLVWTWNHLEPLRFFRDLNLIREIREIRGACFQSLLLCACFVLAWQVWLDTGRKRTEAGCLRTVLVLSGSGNMKHLGIIWNYRIYVIVISRYICYIYVMSRVYMSYLCHIYVSSSALSFSPPCPPAFPQPLDWGACLLSHSCDSCHFSVSLVALVQTLRAQIANSHQLLCTGLHQGLARSAHRTSLPQEGRWEWAKVKTVWLTLKIWPVVTHIFLFPLTWMMIQSCHYFKRRWLNQQKRLKGFCVLQSCFTA